jgi:hypothetical protein
MSNDLMLKTYFIMAFKIGLKSDLRMKLEEASHLTKEQKYLKMVLPGEARSIFFYCALSSAPYRPVRCYSLVSGFWFLLPPCALRLSFNAMLQGRANFFMNDTGLLYT